MRSTFLMWGADGGAQIQDEEMHVLGWSVVGDLLRPAHSVRWSHHHATRRRITSKSFWDTSLMLPRRRLLSTKVST